MRILTHIFILLFFSASAYSQISINDFLKSSNDDEKVKSLQEQFLFLQRKPYQLSPLQKLEVRFQDREFNTHLQRYALRFTPANPWEMRNNNRYFSSLASSVSLERELALKAALLDRYYCIITYGYFAQLRKLMEESNLVISDQIKVLEKQSGSSFFDADEYLDLQVDLVDASVELEEADLELMTLVNRAEQLSGVAVGSQIDWGFEFLIDIKTLQKVVDSISSSRAVSLMQLYQQQKIDLASSAYRLEKSNLNVGFLQTQFDRHRYETNETPINISLGVTIPISNPNKGDMARKRMDMIEAEHDLQSFKKKNNFRDEIIQQRLTRLFTRYAELEKKMVSLENGTLGQTLSTIKGGDPGVVLQFNQNKIKIKVLLAKLHRDILLSYIDYLEFCDRLQQQPLTNFLSKRMEPIR